MKNIDNKIYLASKSPRRRELLRQVGIEFELLLLRERAPRGPEVSEVVLPDEIAADYVARITRQKIECARLTIGWRKLPSRPVLAADTTVVIDNQIFGKPANMTEAIDMISRLSGRTHQVMTSVAVLHDADILQITHCSDVTFGTLSTDTIHAYCATQEPYDKAGGYAIQGLAASFVQHIAGSYSGIMGLPLFDTAQLLQQAGMRIL